MCCVDVSENFCFVSINDKNKELQYVNEVCLEVIDFQCNVISDPYQCKFTKVLY